MLYVVGIVVCCRIFADFDGSVNIHSCIKSTSIPGMH